MQTGAVCRQVGRQTIIQIRGHADRSCLHIGRKTGHYSDTWVGMHTEADYILVGRQTVIRISGQADRSYKYRQISIQAFMQISTKEPYTLRQIGIQAIIQIKRHADGDFIKVDWHRGIYTDK
jgi:hypothetical protein